MIYSGDETGAVVVDVGAHTARFGWAGDDLPKSVFSSLVGAMDLAEPAAPVPSAPAMVWDASSPPKQMKYFVGEAARIPRAHMDVRSPFDMGLIDDFDVLASVWDHGFQSLRCDPSEHPILLSEHTFALPQQRERIIDLIFQRYNPRAVYLAKSPVLQAFSEARSSALVVDMGASATRVTPVVDGYALTKAHCMSEIGGNLMSTAVIDHILRHCGTPGTMEVLPRCMIKKVPRGSGSGCSSASGGAGESKAMDVDDAPRAGSAASSAASSSASVRASSGGSGLGSAGVGRTSASSVVVGGSGRTVFDVVKRTDIECTTSFRAAMVTEVGEDAKQVLLTVHETGHEEGKPVEEKSYELPDGTIIKMGAAREKLTELLFNPTVMAAHSGTLLQRQTTGYHLQSSANLFPKFNMDLGTDSHNKQRSMQVPMPLQRLIHHSLSACSAELRRDLCSHILVTGGGSLLTGVTERLHWEMKTLVPDSFKTRIATPPKLTRPYSTWIGGSVLASLGTFQQMWISREEYREEGSGIVERRCL